MAKNIEKNIGSVRAGVPPIDFSKLSWQEFETLVCDLLEAEGFFNIDKAGGSGGDMGLDILAEETRTSLTGRVSSFRWMIQVKHYATKNSPSGLKASNRNVGHKEISDIIGFLSEHSADGFLVITDTGLTASAVKKISSIHNDRQRREEAHFWDSRILSNRLRKHPDIVKRYFLDTVTDNFADRARRNPFRLLEPFTAVDRKTFFGRTAELEGIVGLVCNAPIAVVFGESGAGKSSLLNAAIIPTFIDLKFIGGAARCLDDPSRSLRVAAINALETVLPEDRIARLRLISNLPEFLECLSFILERDDKRMVIALDQFEELFSRADPLTRSELALSLKTQLTINRSPGRLNLLLVIREDFLGQLWDWSAQNHVAELWTNSYRVRRLSRASAFQAIEGSLLSTGVAVNENLISTIITDLEHLGSGATYPPYLQLVFYRLYDELKKDWANAIPHYNSAGKAEGIILDFFENHLFKGLSIEYQATAKQVLDSLAGTDGMRNLLSEREIKLTIKSIDDQIFSDVLDLLVQRRIITVRTANDGSKAYELVHDFLAKNFFERLDSYQRKDKGVVEVFRRAMKEWSQNNIYPSQPTIDIFIKHKEALTLGSSEWEFLFASAASAQRNTKIREVALKERNIEAMLSCLKSKDCDARASAVRVLGKIKDIDTLPFILSRLKDRDSGVACEALTAMRGFKDKRIVKAITSFISIPQKKDSILLLKAAEVIYDFKDPKYASHLGTLLVYFRKKETEYKLNQSQDWFPEWRTSRLERLFMDLRSKKPTR